MRSPTRAGLLAGAMALLVSRRRRSSTPAAAPLADPATLPRPRLFPLPAPGEQPQAFRGLEDEDTSPPPHARSSWVAVLTMIVGVLLTAAFFLTLSWPLLAAGVVVGLVGVYLAVKAKIMDEVSVTDSPH